MAGGTLWDLGIYCISLTMLIAQEMPQEVYATVIQGPTGVDIAAQCQLTFKNGLIAQCSTNFYSPYNAGMIISGTQGRIELDGPWHPGLWKKNSVTVVSESSREQLFFPLGNPFIYEIQALEDAILENKTLDQSLVFSKNFLTILLALHKSAETGLPIKL